MESIFKDINFKDCEQIYLLNKGKKIIEIYGEIHNKALPKKNSYTDMVDYIHKKKPLILVEHTTKICNIEIMNEKIKKFMLSYGGSETIFYMLKKNKYDKIHCIDNRLELNLLHASYEIEFKNFFKKILYSKDYLINENILQIIIIIKKQIDNIINFKKYFEKTDFEEIYLVHLEVLNRQIEIIFLFLKKYIKNKEFFKGKILEENNWVVFILMLLNITNNLRVFGSLVVDVNILKYINKSRSYNIILYVGINHANRISQILESKDYNLEILKGGKLNLQNSNPYPIYDKKQEIMLLKNLK